MGYRFSVVFPGVIAAAMLLSSLLLVTLPTPAAAFWDGFPFAPPPSQAEEPSINPLMVARLCERQSLLAGRLLRPLIDPDICNPSPPPEEPTVSIAADPLTIDEGDSSMLEWDSEHADSCEASNGWSGTKSTSGSQEVAPTVTTTYTIICEGDGGSDSGSVTVTVIPTPEMATLTLVKNLPNDNGGTAETDDFQAMINSNNVSWNVAQILEPGSYTASETGMSGYTAGDWGGDCAADGTITLEAGETATCTITNDDQPGTLHVVKNLITDNGAEAVESDFSFQVNGGDPVAFEEDGQNDLTVDAGTYTVTEPTAKGFTTTYDNCADIVIPNGGEATCTITNDDVAIEPTTGHLVVDKVTEPGGDDTEFSISASGTGAIMGGGDGVVTDSADKNYEVEPGTYAVTETLPDGWVQISNTCTEIVVAAGETENCVITNAKKPTLTFSADPLTVHENSESDATTTLVWDSTNADSCVASNAAEWTGAKDADGNEVVTPTATTAYQLDCTGSGGSVQATTTVTFVPDVPSADHVVISEVYYDVDADHGVESPPADANEWVELYNPTDSAVDLSFWSIIDSGVSSDILPSGTSIAAHGYLVIVGTSTTESEWESIPDGVPVVNIDSAIGGGLANGGDAMFLRDSATTTIDAMSYGTDESVFILSGVEEGHSLARIPVDIDTDTATDWSDNETPTPGE